MSLKIVFLKTGIDKLFEKVSWYVQNHYFYEVIYFYYKKVLSVVVTDSESHNVSFRLLEILLVVMDNPSEKMSSVQIKRFPGRVVRDV